MRWDSKREYARWQQLWAMKEAGLIRDLRRQVSFRLIVNGSLIGKLILDFVYVRGGSTVYEDVKSKPTITALFKWKRKHFEAQYKVKIELHL